MIRRSARVAALLIVAATIAGCGSTRRAPEPEPPMRPVPPRTEPRLPPEPAAPSPEPTGEESSPRPAPTPRAVVSESQYPVPRIWEWTLSSGMQILFRRSTGAPGRVHVRAWAPGGSITAGTTSGEVVADDGALRMRLGPDESVVEAEAWRRDLPALFESLAGVLGGRADGDAVLTPEAALHAALGGVVAEEGISTRAMASRFGRPGAFRVLVSGDIAADTLIALAATSLGRIRPSAEGLLTSDSARAGRVPIRTVRHRGDGTGRGALVGFRGAVAGSTAGRAPDDIRAGLDVLAQVFAHVLERDGLPSRTWVALDGRVATLVVDVREGDPSVLARRVLQAAGALDITASAVAQARGAAIDVHNRAVQTPAGWIDWLSFITKTAVDPRVAHRYPATLRAVPLERVRLLAEALFDPARTSVVEIGDE